MSTPSLAGEIAQLHELFKLGALTEEEFNTAKQATIRTFMTKASGPATTSAAVPPPSSSDLTTSPASSPLLPAAPKSAPLVRSPTEPSTSSDVLPTSLSPPLPKPSATPTRSRAEWQRLWGTSVTHSPAASSMDPLDVRVQALRCAERLFRNLHAHPTEVKYRRIREANKVIAQELLVVEASAALLSFGGFVREEETAGTNATAEAGGSAAAPLTYVWVQHDDVAEAARKASAACRLVGHLQEFMSGQLSRRYGVQQLWRSVALEVRLERAAREAAAGEGSVLDAFDGTNDGNEETNLEASSAQQQQQRPQLHPLVAYIVECYTVDEAGDGLYSSRQHLQTLQEMYAAQLEALRAADDACAPPPPSSSYSLLETAETYGAVVQQRGAIELLLHGCAARLHPSPSALHRIVAPATASTAPAQEADGSSKERLSQRDVYTIELLPLDVCDASSHVARCLRLLQRVQAEVNHVRQQRAAATREAAEKSMRQELRRERQRQQLEQQRVRSEVELASQSQRRRARLQGGPPRRSSSASSTSTSSSSTGSRGHAGRRGGRESAGRRRVPIAEALAVLMGKRSPPQTRPPAASSSSSPSS